MRILITGSNGQLGSDLVGVLGTKSDHVVTGLDLPDLDITSRGSIARAFELSSPEVVINCAAWTDVDLAEEREEDAEKVNGLGPRLLAQECARRCSKLVQISTDYVFDGTSKRPYSESARLNPKSAYGRTKSIGELEVRSLLPDDSYVVRTAWLYGLRGRNFVKTMLRLEREQNIVAVVDDQTGQPTWSHDLAMQIQVLIEASVEPGIYHATNSGAVSWFQFARKIFELSGADPSRVIATKSSSFIRPAPRPEYSVLSHDHWYEVGITPMRPWDVALESAFDAGLSL